MKVLTYNCCALPVLSGDIPARLERIGGEIAALDPDLILFQELFLEKHIAILRGQLRRWRHVFSWAKAWRTFGGGIAIFSKFPLVEPEFHRFRDQGPWLRYSVLGRISRKGFISAIVHPPEGPAFRLICTHPVADYQGWRAEPAGTGPGSAGSTAAALWRKGAIVRGDPYPGLQRNQFEQLRKFVLDLGRDLPLLVGGDFNVTPVSELFQELLSLTGLRDCMLGSLQPSVLPGKYYKIPFYQAASRRLDYLLLRDGRSGSFRKSNARYVLDQPVAISKERTGTLSDHRGVLAELIWHPARDQAFG